ncbi:hypothetical protein MHU86_20064 [Fragilaria crotonensis]|nr:hypothetical protein MHU86_20064 [Fragilaria crotonensis]
MCGDGTHVLSNASANVFTELEPAQQLATKTVSVVYRQVLGKEEMSSESTKSPCETTSKADTEISVEIAAKASEVESIVANQANVRQEFSSVTESLPEVTISGNSEEDAILQVEKENQSCQLPSSTSEHPMKVDEMQDAITLTEGHKEVVSLAASTTTKPSVAASHESTQSSTIVETISVSEGRSFELSRSTSSTSPHIVAANACDQVNLGPTIGETVMEVAEGVKSEAKPEFDQSFDIGTASIVDVTRSKENPSEESEADAGSQAPNAYKSRTKRLMDIRKTSDRPKTPTSVKKELEMLRQSQGGSSVQNLKDFWARTEQSLSPAIPTKTITPLRDGVNNARLSSPITTAQSLARPNTTPPAPSRESSVGGLNPAEEATMIAEAILPSTAEIGEPAAEQIVAVTQVTSVADDKVTPQPSFAECSEEQFDPITQVPAIKEEKLASQATIAESTAEPAHSLTQATTVERETLEPRATTAELVTELLESVKPETAVAEEISTTVEKETLGPQATTRETLTELLDSAKPETAVAEERSSPRASKPEPTGTPSKAMKQVAAVDDEPLGSGAAVAESTTAESAKDQMSRVQKATTMVALDATVAEPTSARLNPVEQETAGADGVDSAPATIFEPPNEPANPVQEAPTVVVEISDEGPAEEKPIRETPSTKVTKRRLVSFMSLAVAICVAFLAAGAGATLWWHQDYICAPAMGNLAHGRSEAPFWAPPAYKELLFGLLCGAKPEIQLQWIQAGGGLSTLMITDPHSLLVQRQRLVSAIVTPRHISVTNKKGKVELLEAPWAFTRTKAK